MKDTCIPLLIVVLFTIARTRKQPRCLSTDGWIKKLWYMYTMEYYSAIKRKALESVLMRWMNLDLIIQSEVSQKEKGKYCILTRQYSCLDNPMDGGAWWATVHRVTKSQKQLSNFTFTFIYSNKGMLLSGILCPKKLLNVKVQHNTCISVL